MGSIGVEEGRGWVLHGEQGGGGGWQSPAVALRPELMAVRGW
jgi:hypothetical protein